MTDNKSNQRKPNSKSLDTIKTIKCTSCGNRAVEHHHSIYSIPFDYTELDIYICDCCKQPYMIEDLADGKTITFALSPGILYDPNQISF